MLDCLDKKLPDVNDCEGRMHTLWKERVDALAARAHQDFLDLIDTATLPPRGHLDNSGQDNSLQAQQGKDHRMAARAARLQRRQARLGLTIARDVAVVSDSDDEDGTLVPSAHERRSQVMPALKSLDCPVWGSTGRFIVNGGGCMV